MIGLAPYDTTWLQDAACAGRDPDWWAVETYEEAHAAVAVCAACPVLGACDALARALPGTSGVWAGQVWVEGRIRRGVVCAACGQLTDRGSGPTRGRPLCPACLAPPQTHRGCGTRRGAESHRRNGERVCAACRDAERARHHERRTA